MKYLKRFSALIAVAALLTLSGCTLYPRVNLGVDFDYDGGRFHVRPNANVGITGRP